MNRLVIFAVGMICGGGLTAGAFSSHFVQTKDNWLVVPRVGVNLKDIYADVRHWTLDDWRKHPELSRDMVKAGHAEIIQDRAIGELIDETVDRLTQRPDDAEVRQRTQQQSDRSATDFEPEFAP